MSKSDPCLSALMSKRRTLFGGAVLLTAAAAIGAISVADAQNAPPPAAPQPMQWHWPEKMRNPKVLPRNTNADQLRDIMKGFAIGLGVRCTFCHTGTEQMSLAERDFASDANPRKDRARAMMRMVQRLNTRDLPAIAGKNAHVSCYTCHRGSSVPAVTAPMPTRPPAS
jgi:hypothetical protein